MAKPIEIGLELTGFAALDFDEYMKNPVPTFTEKGMKMMAEIIQEERDKPQSSNSLYL